MEKSYLKELISKQRRFYQFYPHESVAVCADGAFVDLKIRNNELGLE